MATLTITLPEGVRIATGRQITFKAPCDCTGVTGIIIGDTTYSLVDSMDKSVGSVGGAFIRDSLVSVMLDIERSKAYLVTTSLVGVVDNLSSEETGYALSANQGRLLNTSKLDKANLANNLTTAVAGYALDARQGKALNDSITNINDGITNINDGISTLKGEIGERINGILEEISGLEEDLSNNVTEINNTLANKSDTTHTHNYAGSSSVGGSATKAVQLETARTVRVNLESTSTDSFNGTKNITPGVDGTLPVANGGTGSATAAGALTNLGAAAADHNHDSTYYKKAHIMYRVGTPTVVDGAIWLKPRT